MSRTTKSNNSTSAPESTDSTEQPVVADESILAAYRNGDKVQRREIRKQVEDSIMSAIAAGDLHGGQVALATKRALQEESAAKPSRPEVPVEVVLARRVAALRLAADMIESGEVVPDSITLPEDFSVESIAAQSVDSTDEELIKSARKLAGAKITRSTERNSIAEAIERAFDGQEVGTVLKISEVVTAATVPGYKPSPGAVRAHFDSCDEESDGSRVRDSWKLLPADNAGNRWRIERVS